MAREQAIEAAAELAYKEDANQVVGEIKGEGWAVAHTEDMGRQAQMSLESMVDVDSSGVVEY